ncbi:MAG TPA: zinc ribbon domain-containing protein [Herbaspirillum sp.]|jgi:hypothetical protein
MSYEFNPESPVFEFPNPYKVENLSLIISGSFATLAGVATMLSVRERISHGPDGRALAVIGIAVALLLFGIFLLARAFTQLRYFFGRNRPESLAPLVATDQDGDSNAAVFYKETLRQNAIAFHEPKGALNGLLYSWLQHLIFAPDVIQRTAQTQFYNFLALVATLLSYLLCWLMFGQGPASSWIGLAYAAFGFSQIVRPMVKQFRPTSGPVVNATNVGSGSLIFLIVLAVLGPVILAMAAAHLPDLDGLSINGALLVALLCAIAGCGVFGLALKNQLQPLPQAVGSARVTETVTMNAHPNKLIEELDRILMDHWYSRIPNRRYTRRSPAVNGQQGKFSAEIFEETQPRPQANRTAANVAHAWSMPQFRWLTVLTGLAMLFLAMGTLSAVFAAHDILGHEQVSTSAGFALSQIFVGMFCYRAAHVLWGRFDFVSTLTWVDINGSFESARVNIGNQVTGNVQTTKNVINIESMTMRVWVSEIDTVIFGKDAQRQLIGMRGLQGIANELAATLKNFGEARSMIVAPGSAMDFERAQKTGIMNQLVGGKAPAMPDPALTAALFAAGAQSGSIASQSDNGDVQSRFCSNCRYVLDGDAGFCGECGTPVTA